MGVDAALDGVAKRENVKKSLRSKMELEELSSSLLTGKNH